jgi:hypothetical protein
MQQVTIHFIPLVVVRFQHWEAGLIVNPFPNRADA